MNAVQITVRDVNPAVFQEFKASAVRKGLKLGSALSLAMEKFLSQEPKLRFTSLKPISWGPGTEHVSEDVDKILYEE